MCAVDDADCRFQAQCRSAVFLIVLLVFAPDLEKCSLAAGGFDGFHHAQAIQCSGIHSARTGGYAAGYNGQALLQQIGNPDIQRLQRQTDDRQWNVVKKQHGNIQHRLYRINDAGQ